VARCLSLVFNVIFTYAILGRTTGWTTCATLLIVICGFALGINGELNFSLFGTSAGVLSSVFVSLNSIFTSKMLAAVDNDKSQLLYYNNFNAAVLFVPLIVLFEGHVLLESAATLMSAYFWLCMTLTGVMGFLIGLVTVLQVKATSPLTHNISGTAKAAAQSLLAFYIWGNAATLQGVAGILLVIVGSGLYTWVQMSLPAAPPAAPPAAHHLAKSSDSVEVVRDAETGPVAVAR
jgi:GDP-fucose transporter C1